MAPIDATVTSDISLRVYSILYDFTLREAEPRIDLQREIVQCLLNGRIFKIGLSDYRPCWVPDHPDPASLHIKFLRWNAEISDWDERSDGIKHGLCHLGYRPAQYCPAFLLRYFGPLKSVFQNLSTVLTNGPFTYTYYYLCCRVTKTPQVSHQPIET